MKYNKEYIQDLLDKFMEGQTTENEEQMLSEFFATSEDIPAEWMPYKEMFQSFKADAYDFSEAELDEMLQPKPAKKSRIISIWPWLSAACVAAVVALFFFHPWSTTTVTEQPTVAQVKPKVTVQKKDSIVNNKKIVKDETQVAVVPSPSQEQEVVAKPLNDTVLLADNKTPTKRQHKHKSSQPVQPEPNQDQDTSTAEQEISTAELLETVNVLADIESGDANISVAPSNKGFIVRTVSTNGQSNSYMLRRCSNSTTIELTNQVINLKNILQ